MLDINDIFEKGLPFDGHYKLVDLLSTAGGSADVWLAIDCTTNEPVDMPREASVNVTIGTQHLGINVFQAYMDSDKRESATLGVTWNIHELTLTYVNLAN